MTASAVTRTRALLAPAAGTAVPVVLYLRIPPSQAADAERLIGRLRTYALEHGWRVRGRYVDHVPLASLTVPRPAWSEVIAEIESGRARGIVAPIEAMCAYHTSQREQFGTWLAANRAFVAYAGLARQPTSTAIHAERTGPCR